MSAVLAVALSAAQLFPVIEFAIGSARTLEHGPHEVFSFSLQPVRLAEMVWPNVYGTLFPRNSSWLSAIQFGSKPAKIWSPSLYISAFTFLFAMSALRFRGSRETAWHVWMTAIASVGIAASLGEYAGPIGWARLMPGAATVIGKPDPAGSMGIRLDGMLRRRWQSLLGNGDVSPRFKFFRFPSKLLTWTTLALTVVAAQAWDSFAAGDRQLRRRLASYSAALLGLTIVALAVASAGRTAFIAGLQGRTEDSYGPIDAQAAFADLRRGLVQGGLTFAAVLGLAIRKARPGAVCSSLVLAALTVDLSVANARNVVTIPQRLLDAPPEALKLIAAAESTNPTPGPSRIHRLPFWEPIGWTQTTSAYRDREFVTWERDNVTFPSTVFAFGVDYTLSYGAAELRDYTVFFDAFRRELEPGTSRERCAFRPVANWTVHRSTGL